MKIIVIGKVACILQVTALIAEDIEVKVSNPKDSVNCWILEFTPKAVNGFLNFPRVLRDDQIVNEKEYQRAW